MMGYNWIIYLIKGGIVKITSRGRITIPAEIRRRLGLLPGTKVTFQVEGDEVRIVKATGHPGRGKRLIEHMRGRGTVNMTTDEIMAHMRRKP